MEPSDRSPDEPLFAGDVSLTMADLCRACGATETHVTAWVLEGALDPIGGSPAEWRFSGVALRRARTAARLSRDFDIDAPGIALALDLLDEIADLRARLARIERR